ncbi:hypothetical protein OEG84_19395 [Hoeflea sp. G2-23]|uniref:Acetophenone carboxylase-like C-terminal domain-containing protein n=1 Tax=Hoeflea algicola TaxID=2983763 RepID=A0ABT3ZDL3_9HYPH|nr:hypothetical protein [Hoeflea algicola]MCY0149813.1 hypothetical protein [Hoeflea algicola]
MRLILVNLRTTVIGKRDRVDVSIIAPKSDQQKERCVSTHITKSYFEGSWIKTNVYYRDALISNNTYIGPAIIKQVDTTIYIDSKSNFNIDEFGNIIITVKL